MPTAKIKKAWIDIAATPSMYMSGLTELLGKIQEEYQKNPDRHTEKLVPDKLLITEMGMDYVYTLDLDTNMVAVCGKTGSGCFNDPAGLVVDSKGNWLKADSRNHRLCVYTGQGALVKYSIGVVVSRK